MHHDARRRKRIVCWELELAVIPSTSVWSAVRTLEQVVPLENIFFVDSHLHPARINVGQ